MNAIWGSPQGEDATLEPLDKASGYRVSGSPTGARDLIVATCPVTWSHNPVH